MRANVRRWGLLWGLGILLLPASHGAAAQERVDVYDTQSRRQGYVTVDRSSGQLDFYDAQSRRLGYGVIRPGRTGVDVYRPDGQRWLEGRPAWPPSATRGPEPRR